MKMTIQALGQWSGVSTGQFGLNSMNSSIARAGQAQLDVCGASVVVHCSLSLQVRLGSKASQAPNSGFPLGLALRCCCCWCRRFSPRFPCCPQPYVAITPFAECHRAARLGDGEIFPFLGLS